MITSDVTRSCDLVCCAAFVPSSLSDGVSVASLAGQKVLSAVAAGVAESGLLLFALASRTHRLNVLGGIPISRATLALGFPVVRTVCTARAFPVRAIGARRTYHAHPPTRCRESRQPEPAANEPE